MISSLLRCTRMTSQEDFCGFIPWGVYLSPSDSAPVEKPVLVLHNDFCDFFHTIHHWVNPVHLYHIGVTLLLLKPNFNVSVFGHRWTGKWPSSKNASFLAGMVVSISIQKGFTKKTIFFFFSSFLSTIPVMQSSAYHVIWPIYFTCFVLLKTQEHLFGGFNFEVMKLQISLTGLYHWMFFQSLCSFSLFLFLFCNFGTSSGMRYYVLLYICTSCPKGDVQGMPWGNFWTNQISVDKGQGRFTKHIFLLVVKELMHRLWQNCA